MTELCEDIPVVMLNTLRKYVLFDPAEAAGSCRQQKLVEADLTGSQYEEREKFETSYFKMYM